MGATQFTFPGLVLDQSYFSDSHVGRLAQGGGRSSLTSCAQTIIAFTTNNKVWQSSNEGYSWNPVANGVYVVAMTMHAY